MWPTSTKTASPFFWFPKTCWFPRRQSWFVSARIGHRRHCQNSSSRLALVAWNRGMPLCVREFSTSWKRRQHDVVFPACLIMEGVVLTADSFWHQEVHSITNFYEIILCKIERRFAGRHRIWTAWCKGMVLWPWNAGSRTCGCHSPFKRKQSFFVNLSEVFDEPSRFDFNSYGQYHYPVLGSLVANLPFQTQKKFNCEISNCIFFPEDLAGRGKSRSSNEMDHSPTTLLSPHKKFCLPSLCMRNWRSLFWFRIGDFFA